MTDQKSKISGKNTGSSFIFYGGDQEALYREVIKFADSQKISKFDIVEVEPEAAESIFYFLRDNGYANTYLQPDKKIMSQYVYQETETIIVKSLISKSPLQKSNNVAIPRLEKILVDIFCEEIQLSSFRGEMENIFKTACEQLDINFSVLLNYANRRGKKKELIEYMKQNTIAPEGLFT